MCGKRPALNRTYYAAECRVTINGKRYMLYMPFNRDMVDKIESLESRIQGIAAKFIAHQTVLRNEINFIGITGQAESYDIILQELPSGITLKEAMMRYSILSIRYIIKALRRDMQKFYFTHGNLNLNNIIVDAEYEPHLLRYWYSDFGTLCQDNFSKLEGLVETYYHSTHALSANSAENRATPYQQHSHITIASAAQGGKPDALRRYSWATEFIDGVAIVASDTKMGAIDTLGRTIIPTEYNDLEFDSEQGIFYAYKDGHRYLFDHNGYRVE